VVVGSIFWGFREAKLGCSEGTLLDGFENRVGLCVVLAAVGVEPNGAREGCASGEGRVWEIVGLSV
jgi:hypothetical protein